MDVGSTAQSLGSVALLRGVYLQVDSDSIDPCGIGEAARVWVVGDGDGMVGNGISLDAGDRYFFLPVSSLGQIWLVAASVVRVYY
ncbi:MAG: hypothetical protein HC881_13210 [Leptolyngbyaceae cyanobacterium SL_7_1]|nr:hypothetical protein [Leptolyngbyaceae cyanobacterium SL_7_1]